MNRNSLQGFANTLADMSVAIGAKDLYIAVADLRDGIIVVDLLQRTAMLDGVMLPPNAAVNRLADWLNKMASRTRATTPASLLVARLELSVDSRSVPTARDSLLYFVIRGRCLIRTNKEMAESESATGRLWIDR